MLGADGLYRPSFDVEAFWKGGRIDSFAREFTPSTRRPAFERTTDPVVVLMTGEGVPLRG